MRSEEPDRAEWSQLADERTWVFRLLLFRTLTRAGYPNWGLRVPDVSPHLLGDGESTQHHASILARDTSVSSCLRGLNLSSAMANNFPWRLDSSNKALKCLMPDVCRIERGNVFNKTENLVDYEVF